MLNKNELIDLVVEKTGMDAGDVANLEELLLWCVNNGEGVDDEKLWLAVAAVIAELTP